MLMRFSRVVGPAIVAAVVACSAVLPGSTAIARDAAPAGDLVASEPSSAEPTGPLGVTLVQTLRHNTQGDGPVPWTNCPATCAWVDNDLGYASTQRWGSASEVGAPITQAVAGITAAPAGSTAELGAPFLMTHFAHFNIPIRGDSPTQLAIQTLLTVQPPAGSPAVFSMRGPSSLGLQFV